MKRTTKNAVSFGAEEIITSNLYIDGVEIGTAMLPKLVHRTSLSPVVVDGVVEQRQYYTLHNDAGDCVFVSPALQNRMNKMWHRPWRWNWRTAESWHLHPILVPEGSIYGALLWDDTSMSLPDGTIHTDKEIVTDISWWYATNKRKTVIPPPYAGYKAKNIQKANHTWEKSGLTSYKLNLPKCVEGIRMFAECDYLTKFEATDFKSLEHAEGMFEKCYQISTIPTTKDVFSSVKYASKMYKETAITEFDLDMSNLETAEEMFYYCSQLASFSGNVPKLKNMNSMFDTCYTLTTLSGKTDEGDKSGESGDDTGTSSGGTGSTSTKIELNSVQTAKYAFYLCDKLPTLNCEQMSSLTDADFMFYGCSVLNNVQTLFNSLRNAKGMFQNCFTLSTLRTANDNQFPALENSTQMFANCRQLTSFNLNLPALQNGTNMFRGCTKLTSITNVNLQSLNTGLAMFAGGVKLDSASCVALGNALRANAATWESIINGQRNGIGVGVDGSLRNNEAVRAALGLDATISDPVVGLGSNEEAGQITNSIGSKILTRVSWNS